MVIEEKTSNLKPQCLKDSHIMEYLIRRVNQGEELAELNKFQIYLKATRLSDLVTGDKKSISPTLWLGNPNIKKLQ